MDFIDVSQFQGNIDWEKVSKKYTMAIIRAGYRGYAAGNIKEDPYARKNIKGALDNGIKVGLYFMSQAVNQSEADAEAQFCIALLRAYGITSAEIAYDSEWSGAPNRSGRADGLSRAARTEICNRFCLIVAQAGYSPLCYASTSWFDEHLVKSDLHMGIWCAQYASRNTLTGLAWKYWQYTSSGTVDGIQGKVDISRTAENVVSGPAQNVTTATDRIDVQDSVMTLSLAEDGEKLFYIDGKKSNFHVYEFACRDRSDKILVDGKLVRYLQKIRDHFKAPVSINSAYRNEAYNAKIGGAHTSYHCKGMAADIVVTNVPTLEVAQYAQRAGMLGIGWYNYTGGFVHVDTRSSKYYWRQDSARSSYYQVQSFIAESKNPVTYNIKGYTLRTLRYSDKGEDVRFLQQLLTAQGFACGTADGAFGGLTETAVRNFQRKHGLSVDGVCGQNTWSAILAIY